MTTIVDTTLRFTNDSHETSTEQQETDIAEWNTWRVETHDILHSISRALKQVSRMEQSYNRAVLRVAILEWPKLK
jgi:hypothetical protein